MKYNNIGVMFPWMNTDGERCMTRFRFYAPTDRREIRRQVKKAFLPTGIKLDNAYIDFCLKHRAYDLGIGETTA
jgi:hypothetical protein